MLFSRHTGSLAALFVVLLIVHTAQVQAVYKGMDVTSGAGANGIFMVSFQRAPFDDGTPKPVQLAGTATNVKYKRCFITAKHISEGDDFTVDVFKGDDLQTITNAVKRQRIVKHDALPSDGPAPVYRDIGVFWVQKLLEEAGGVKRLVDADYAKWELGKADELGLTPDAAELAIADGKKLRMVGYGHNRYEHPDVEGLPLDIKTDLGIGKKRAGFPVATQLSEAGNGAYVKALPVAADLMRTACAGDSGSPLQLDTATSKVVGVLSGSQPGHCEERAGDYIAYAALTDPAAEGETSNWKLTNRLIDAVCFKSLQAEISGAGGKVMGSLSPGQAWPPLPNPDPNPLFNDGIACGDGVTTQDCGESMHEGQVMSLTAYATVPNTVFDHWDATAGAPCPCVTSGLTNPACDVDYEDVGYYTETSSMDMSVCKAVFAYQSSSSSSSSAAPPPPPPPTPPPPGPPPPPPPPMPPPPPGP